MENLIIKMGGNMKNKNELAKEERTIFIVLAIIVLIAIGVLVTWYFTKDKKEEEKDKVTKDKTVEVKKKDTSDLENSEYTFTPSNTVVVNDNIKEEEINIVDVAAEAQETESSKQSYNYKSPVYLVNDNVSFNNVELIDETGEIVNITNGKVLEVKAYTVYTEGMITLTEIEAAGKYIINEDNTVTFTASGLYGIVIQKNDGTTYETLVRICSDEEFNIMAKNVIDFVLRDLKPISSYNADKYTAFMTELDNYKNAPTNTEKRSTFNNLVEAYIELTETYNPNITYGEGKKNDEKTNSDITYGTGSIPTEKVDVTYGTGGNVQNEITQPEITYGTGGNTKNEPTVKEVTFGTGKSENTNESVSYGTGGLTEKEDSYITYGTGVPTV